MANLMLEAHDLGIGSCWIHRAKEEFESEEGKEILKSLGNERFVSKAPEAKVQEEKDKLAKYQQMLEQVKEQIARIS